MAAPPTKRDTVRLAEADHEYQNDATRPYGHASKAMEAYEQWFQREGENGQRQLAILRLEASAVNCGVFISSFPLLHNVQLTETGRFPFVRPNQLRSTTGAQARNLPIMKGGSPPKKRQISSLPPFARHLKYAPRSGSDPIRACGIKLLPSFE